MRLIFLAMSAVLSLASCTDGFVSFPVTTESQKSLGDDVEVIRLTAENIASFSSPARGHNPASIPSPAQWDYTVGVGDILNVIVFDHPELTTPAGPQRSAEESGFRVQSDGTFFYPFIGQVQARGRVPEDIRAEVTQRLAEYIPSPQVEVRVAAFNSQSIVVSGEVKSPNRQPLTTVPLTLVEAVTAAGGLSDIADGRRVSVQRGGTRYDVDLDGYLKAGMVQNNPILRAGDVVNVPRRQAEEAYLLGQVLRPDVIDLSQEPVTLTQALTRQGGLDEVRADARGVFVFRNRTPGKITVFQLETSDPTGMLLGTSFVLEPSDVVYIVRSPLQKWNDAISGLLPTVRAVAAVDSAAAN
jgi:polysaccharide export outer membrane protein